MYNKRKQVKAKCWLDFSYMGVNPKLFPNLVKNLTTLLILWDMMIEQEDWVT